MQTTLSWLKEYTPVDRDPPAVADIFTHLGLEVESVSGACEPREGILVGKVLETKKHPEADRLTVNRVDFGGNVLEIVCGAPNVRPGLLVPVILAGNALPDGTVIKKSKIRGVVCNGMICCERELGISAEAAGIMELRADAAPGEVFSAKHFDADPLFEIAVLPNRPDCLSVYGLARELNARLKGGLRFPEVRVREGGVRAAEKIRVEIADASACPRYSARYISGVKIGPSPEWMRKRLQSVGIRSINNVVDATNFVLMELGHPLHAFDYSRVAKGTIVVRKAGEGEKFVTLDSVERTLTADDLLICDAERPVALAGVMGGANSEI
ncbi:MAG: YtpR family tRNA-binding protein, partial [Syntrophaceae bacterium]